MISSPALHSWLFLANHIRYDPIRAILPSAPLSFWIPLIPTRLQMYSRLAALRRLITPLQPISKGMLRASNPASLRSSVSLSYLAVFLSSLEVLGRIPGDGLLHQQDLDWRRSLVNYHQVRLLLGEGHLVWNCATVYPPPIEVGIHHQPILLPPGDGVEEVLNCSIFRSGYFPDPILHFV